MELSLNGLKCFLDGLKNIGRYFRSADISYNIINFYRTEELNKYKKEIEIDETIQFTM